MTFNSKELGLIYKAVDLYKNSLSQYQSVEYEDCEEILDRITPNDKMMLGEARSKFGQLPGAQGGVTLNGADLKAEAQSSMDRLEEEIRNYTDGGDPLGIIIG